MVQIQACMYQYSRAIYRSIKDFVAPELRAAGITDADLAVLESGADPKNIQGQLQQIVRNRQALVGSNLGGNVSAAGGGLFPAQRAAV